MNTQYNKNPLPDENGSNQYAIVGEALIRSDRGQDGIFDFDMSGGNVTIKDTAATDSNSHYRIWKTSGLTANRELLAPARPWLRLVKNVSAYDAKLVLAFSGPGITVPAGQLRVIFCDGITISVPNIDLATTGITAGSYTNVNITVDAYGRITAISNGTAGSGGGAVYIDDLTDVVLSTPTTGQVLKFNGTNWVNDTDATGGGGTAVSFIHLRDQKSSGGAGGSFTSGAWRTRTLNTEVSDVDGKCALSSNQFTLAAGTYEIEASAPAYMVNQHQLRLQNITDAATILTGQNAFANDGSNVCSSALLYGRFTIAANKSLELQHQGSSARSADGFGRAGGFGTEVYAEIILRKVA